MKILITGSRKWQDEETIKSALLEYNNFDNPIVIHGNARGADSIAAKVAESFGWQVVSVPAEWNKYGKAAGMIRNKKMIDMTPDVVLAFPLEDSIGTVGCIKLAESAGIYVRVFKPQRLGEQACQ